MYKFLTKNGQTISFMVGLAITVIFLIIVFGGMDKFNMLDEKVQNQSNLFNFGINASVALIAICAIGMIAFIILNVITNLKGNIKLLIGLGVMAIIYFAMSAGADMETTGPIAEGIAKSKITPGQNGFIVGGIWTAVVLSVGAFASFIILEILNFFK